VLAPLFVLCNPAAGLAGVLLAGQTFAPRALLFSVALLSTRGVIGTAIGLRWDVGAHHARATRIASVHDRFGIQPILSIFGDGKAGPITGTRFHFNRRAAGRRLPPPQRR
jgi:hypothetical protein